jgi:hypothetical protein
MRLPGNNNTPCSKGAALDAEEIAGAWGVLVIRLGLLGSLF